MVVTLDGSIGSPAHEMHFQLSLCSLVSVYVKQTTASRAASCSKTEKLNASPRGPPMTIIASFKCPVSGYHAL